MTYNYYSYLPTYIGTQFIQEYYMVGILNVVEMPATD